MKRLLVPLLALLLALAGLAPAASAQAAPAPQWRSYWVDAFGPGIYDAQQVSKLVADAKRVNANVLLVQAVRHFDCFCNASDYPRTHAAIAPAPFDPLAEIVKQGKAAGLQIHAWVNVTPLWNSAFVPPDPTHAYHAHGFAATGADRWLNKRFDGVEKVGNISFVDPANPAVVEAIVRGINSIQRNYDVDGINLDYVRYPDYNSRGNVNDWGYSEVSLARFRAATGRTDVPAPADAQFAQWRRDQVSGLVRRIYVSMYDTDRADRLSINGVAYGYGPTTGPWERSAPYAEVLQDWRGWAAEGIVDTVTAMNYKRESLPAQVTMFDTWNAYLARAQAETGRTMVSGPALYMNDIDQSLTQASEVVSLGLGWSGYSYANPSAVASASGSTAVKDAERDALADRLTAELFREKAPAPPMAWKDRPTDGILAGTVTAGGRPLDQGSVTITAAAGGATRTVRTDGSGWFAALGLEPGRYRVQVFDRAGSPGRTAAVVVKAGAVTDASVRGPVR